jgi:hypothetical protein
VQVRTGEMMKKFSIVAYLLCVLLLSLHTQAQQQTPVTFWIDSGQTYILPNITSGVSLPTGCTGTVSFLLDGTVLGTSTVAFGEAYLNDVSWSVGAHNLTANYSGDASCAPGSNSVAFTIVKDTPSFRVETSADSILSNQDLIVGVAVTNTSNNSDYGCYATTQGTVTLTANGTAVATRPLSSFAWFAIPAGSLPPGNQNITATYNGSSSCSPGSTSVAINVTDFRNVPSPVLLSSSSNPGSDSSPISFTAQVLGNSPAPTGNAQLKEGETVLRSSAVTTISAQNLLGPLVREPLVGEDANDYAEPYGGSASDGDLQFRAGTAPDGSNGAVIMSGWDFSLQTEYCAPSALHQFSIFAKELTPGQQFRLRAQFYGDSAYEPASETVSDWFTTSSSWQQFSISATAPAGIGYCVMEVELPDTGSNSLYLWGPQIQWGTAVGPYVRGYLFGLQEDDTRNANVANISATLSAGTHNLLATYSGDSNYQSGSSAQLVELVNSGVPVVPLAIATSSLPAGILNDSYGATLIPDGGVAPYTWSVVSGSLPAGLSLDAERGVIAGAPTAVGATTFTVQVSDASANTATTQFSLNITAPLVITTAYLPSGSQNVPYAAQIAVSGGQAPYIWSLFNGSSPDYSRK